MYLQFYKFSKDPFRMTPEAETGFWSTSQHAVLTALTEGFEYRQGLIVITGEVGLGKTTVLRSHLKRMASYHPRMIHISNANLYLSFKGLVKTMLMAWEEKEESDNLYELLNRLQQVLLDDYRKGRAIMLLIDEAQNLPLVTLKHLTTFSNFETDADKLLQIVLIGQPELHELLNHKELRQLAQRIERYETLSPLSPQESLSYIDYRLGNAAPQDDTIFSPEAKHHLIQAANGTPRVLNRLCANALFQGARQREKPITAKTAKHVLNEWKDQSTVASSRRLVYVAAAAAILVLGLLWFARSRPPVSANALSAVPLSLVREALSVELPAYPASIQPPIRR